MESSKRIDRTEVGWRLFFASFRRIGKCSSGRFASERKESTGTECRSVRKDLLSDAVSRRQDMHGIDEGSSAKLPSAVEQGRLKHKAKYLYFTDGGTPSGPEFRRKGIGRRKCWTL